MSWLKEMRDQQQAAWAIRAEQIGREVPGIVLQPEAETAPFVTLKTGGRAGLLCTVYTSDQLQALIHWLNEYEIHWTALGGGSNLLIRDGGYEGALIRLAHTQECDEFIRIQVTEESGWDRVSAGAALPMARLVKLARHYGWSDFAPLAGVPGTTGGAVAGNAGSRTVWISHFLVALDIMDSEGKIRTVAPEKLHMAYRSTSLGRRDLVLDIELRMERDNPERAAKLIDDQIAYRGRTQPMSSHNCGSVFRNPEGESAGRLIEAAGLKGLRIHGAHISEVHANFIENSGAATASDIEALVWLVHKRVFSETGIDMEREIRIIGREKQ